MCMSRLLLAAILFAGASAAQADPKISIGYCGDADILLEFKGATLKHPLIQELRAAMVDKLAAKFGYNSIEGANSSMSLYLRNRLTNALHPVPTNDFTTLRCIERRSETYLVMASHCGGSGCNPYGSHLFWVNRWAYLTHKGAISVTGADCEWECLVHALGPAFEVEEDVIMTLLETGDPSTFGSPPKKKRRQPANTLPRGKECEAMIAVYEECVGAQRERCLKALDLSVNLSNASRGNYVAITGLNSKFDTHAFEHACQVVCRPGGKALTAKAITSRFCG